VNFIAPNCPPEADSGSGHAGAAESNKIATLQEEHLRVTEKHNTFREAGEAQMGALNTLLDYFLAHI
jgi:hypothetical protein